jgi:hypothetical protein
MPNSMGLNDLISPGGRRSDKAQLDEAQTSPTAARISAPSKFENRLLAETIRDNPPGHRPTPSFFAPS